MPELPEVETTRRALAGVLKGKTLLKLIIRQPKLRYPVRADLPQLLEKRTITDICRRAKYVIIKFSHGNLLIHLGMSGSLRMIEKTKQPPPPLKHDHLEAHFADYLLRYHDPRRFGYWLWEDAKLPAEHSKLSGLGVEPLERKFSAAYFGAVIRGKTTPIKSLLMNNKYLVGVGNIYASESLWLAGIIPFRAAGELTTDETAKLVRSVKSVLKKSLQAGGTSLRDYVTAEGTPGYFVLKLNVYGKQGSPCRRCGASVRRSVLGQRSAFYCPKCQK